MPKARTATSLQRGCIFNFSNANPPVISAPIGDTSPLLSTGLNWKAGLQGWTYFNESYMDVSGVTTTQKDTIFIAAADVQQPFTMQADTTGPPVAPYQSTIYEYFLITDRQVSKDAFFASIGTAAAGNASGVGFLDSPIDQSQVILGFQRTYQPRYLTYAASPSIDLLEIASNNFGHATSTAAGRLYCYHVAWSYTAAPAFVGGVTIPDCRFIVNYVSEKEKDLVYLERLRRSVVQQGG